MLIVFYTCDTYNAFTDSLFSVVHAHTLSLLNHTHDHACISMLAVPVCAGEVAMLAPLLSGVLPHVLRARHHPVVETAELAYATAKVLSWATVRVFVCSLVLTR